MFGVDLGSLGTLQFCEARAVTEYTSMYFRGVPTTRQAIDCESFCPPSCEISYYTMTPSAASWPRSGCQDEQILKTELTSTYRKVINFKSMAANEQLDFIQDTSLVFSVYFETTSVETYMSSPKYDGAVLFSNFGGALGLCLGFSALTGIEILELMGDLICFLFRKVRMNDISPK